MSASRAAACVGLGFLLLAAACKAKPHEPPKEVREDGIDVKLAPKALAAAHLTTAHPRLIPRAETVVAMGRVEFVPNRVARIGPPIGGRIQTLPVVVGQKVARGAVLVTVESAEVGRARAELNAARTRVERATAEVDREGRLLDGGATSARAVLLAETDQAQAKALVQSAEGRLATLGLGASAVGQSFALAAPIPGTVLQVNARVGQPVGPTDTLVVIGESDQVWVEADVYERDIGKLREGREARVTSIAYPGRVFEGKLDEIGEIVDAERRTLEVRIVLPNHDGALKPGMSAEARIVGVAPGACGTALVVSRHSIQLVDGQPFVFVEHTPGKYEMRPIERGTDLDENVEVLRGVNADETIVVDGSFILKSEALKGQMGAND